MSAGNSNSTLNVREVKAPFHFQARGDEKIVFLAGSIEQGQASDWQRELVESLCASAPPSDWVFPHASNSILVLNPRRENWNPDLVQSIDEPEFADQVNWEMDGIEQADIIFFYLQADTLSPISLCELGFALASYPEKVIVVCENGFWRSGNVEVMMDRYGKNHRLFRYAGGGQVALLSMLRGPRSPNR